MPTHLYNLRGTRTRVTQNTTTEPPVLYNKHHHYNQVNPLGNYFSGTPEIYRTTNSKKQVTQNKTVLTDTIPRIDLIAGESLGYGSHDATAWISSAEKKNGLVR